MKAPTTRFLTGSGVTSLRWILLTGPGVVAFMMKPDVDGYTPWIIIKLPKKHLKKQIGTTTRLSALAIPSGPGSMVWLALTLLTISLPKGSLPFRFMPLKTNQTKEKKSIGKISRSRQPT